MVPMMKLTGKPIVWGGGGSVYFILKIPFGNQSYEMTIYAIDRGFPLIKIIELLATNDIYRFYNGVDDPSPNAEEQKERTDFWNTSQKFMRPSEMELWRFFNPTPTFRAFHLVTEYLGLSGRRITLKLMKVGNRDWNRIFRSRNWDFLSIKRQFTVTHLFFT